jgi:hypothetical protein
MLLKTKLRDCVVKLNFVCITFRLGCGAPVLGLHQVHEGDYGELADTGSRVVRECAELPRTLLKALAQPTPVLLLRRHLGRRRHNLGK